ncbi:MAG TPA: M23 family metallopeptidase, partial [Thermoleophilaceae bacterium]|nr:M23 family metallopeptidase [Thermoleophilaceae bacterium]
RYGVGVAPKAARRKTARKPRPRRAAGTVLRSFAVDRDQLFLHGRPARVSFRLGGRRGDRLRLELRSARQAAVSTVDLGMRAPGKAHVVLFTGREHGALPEGRYELRLAGRRLTRARSVTGSAPLQVLRHRFPLGGPFEYGGSGSRFGAARRGHSHQGQDLAAAEGTPVLAPRAGTVEAVGYQAAGAGHYVVLDGDDEDRDYVFMHLRTGSIAVREKQRVATGQAIAQVGSTGGSSGPHLHFEIWVGGWYAGGKPIDPLPHLRRWDAARPATTRSRA